jgi:hypothetical protein
MQKMGTGYNMHEIAVLVSSEETALVLMMTAALEVLRLLQLVMQNLQNWCVYSLGHSVFFLPF